MPSPMTSRVMVLECAQMSELVDYLKTSTLRLSKDVSNVDEVGNTLRWLRDLRQREADLEQVLLSVLVPSCASL